MLRRVPPVYYNGTLFMSIPVVDKYRALHASPGNDLYLVLYLDAIVRAHAHDLSMHAYAHSAWLTGRGPAERT